MCLKVTYPQLPPSSLLLKTWKSTHLRALPPPTHLHHDLLRASHRPSLPPKFWVWVLRLRKPPQLFNHLHPLHLPRPLTVEAKPA